MRRLQVGREGPLGRGASRLPGETGMRTGPATQLGPVLGKSVHATCRRLRL
jgi:hypothetical protein